MAVIISCDRCEAPVTIRTWVGEDEEEIGLFCPYCGDDVDTPGWLLLGISDDRQGKGGRRGSH